MANEKIETVEQLQEQLDLLFQEYNNSPAK